MWSTRVLLFPSWSGGPQANRIILLLRFRVLPNRPLLLDFVAHLYPHAWELVFKEESRTHHRCLGYMCQYRKHRRDTTGCHPHRCIRWQMGKLNVHQLSNDDNALSALLDMARASSRKIRYHNLRRGLCASGIGVIRIALGIEAPRLGCPTI